MNKISHCSLLKVFVLLIYGWGSIRNGVLLFQHVFDWGFIHIYMGWGSNQEWGFNGANTVGQFKVESSIFM